MEGGEGAADILLLLRLPKVVLAHLFLTSRGCNCMPNTQFSLMVSCGVWNGVVWCNVVCGLLWRAVLCCCVLCSAMACHALLWCAVRVSLFLLRFVCRVFFHRPVLRSKKVISVRCKTRRKGKVAPLVRTLVVHTSGVEILLFSSFSSAISQSQSHPVGLNQSKMYAVAVTVGAKWRIC